MLPQSQGSTPNTLDNLLEGCQIIGFDWRYVYVNDSAVRDRQLSKAALLGHTIMDVYPGIENTEMFTALRLCMQERTPQHIENALVYADGTTAWFNLSIQPVPEGIFILSIDITERKQAETALQRYTQRMEILHEIDLGILRGGSILSLVETTLKQIRQIIPCKR